MATSNVTKYGLSSQYFTMVGSNVTGNVTFQVVGSYPVWINYSNTGAAPPNTATGFAYDRYQGELQQSLSVLTLLSGANTIFARAMSANSSIVVEM